MFRGFLRIKLSALVFTLWVIENQTSFLMAFRSENIFFLFGIFFSLIFYYFPTCQPSSSGQTELNISLFGSKKKIVKIVYLLSWNEISCEKNKNHFLNDLLIKEVKLQLKKLWMKRFHLPLWEFFLLQLCIKAGWPMELQPHLDISPGKLEEIYGTTVDGNVREHLLRKNCVAILFTGFLQDWERKMPYPNWRKSSFGDIYFLLTTKKSKYWPQELMGSLFFSTLVHPFKINALQLHTLWILAPCSGTLISILMWHFGIAAHLTFDISLKIQHIHHLSG